MKKAEIEKLVPGDLVIVRNHKYDDHHPERLANRIVVARVLKVGWDTGDTWGVRRTEVEDGERTYHVIGYPSTYGRDATNVVLIQHAVWGTRDKAPVESEADSPYVHVKAGRDIEGRWDPEEMLPKVREVRAAAAKEAAEIKAQQDAYEARIQAEHQEALTYLREVGIADHSQVKTMTTGYYENRPQGTVDLTVRQLADIIRTVKGEQ